VNEEPFVAPVSEEALRREAENDGRTA